MQNTSAEKHEEEAVFIVVKPVHAHVGVFHQHAYSSVVDEDSVNTNRGRQGNAVVYLKCLLPLNLFYI